MGDEIRFDQPSDCVLKSATIQLTLDEDDQGLESYRVDDSQVQTSECPVLITDYYGPGQIVGTSKRVLVNKSLNIAPSINVAGSGGSLGGMKTDKQFVHESRWMFRSYTVPGDGTRGQSWGHRILKWEMTENDIEKYPVHSNKVFTAFAYEHSGQPFLMKVEISGKLKQRGDRVKASLGRALKKFGPRARNQEDISTTLVGAYRGHRRPLDELAKGLSNAMDMKNSVSSPHVVRDTQTASFQQVAFDATPSTDADGGVELVSADTSTQGFVEEGTPQLRLNFDGRTPNMLEGMEVPVSRDRTVPTLENLARPGLRYRTLIRKESIRTGTSSEVSGHSSAATLVANQYTQPQTELRLGAKSQSSMAPLAANADKDAVERLMKVAFFRLLIEFTLSIIKFFETGDSGDTTSVDQ
ncbi:hypothetical protein N0V82_005554 [Gnomoniopsis sp. IMI 355080]|nr:hypothetical protein N0V82_005554 [Gnomoniopsis sp. IMI 355080]